MLWYFLALGTDWRLGSNRVTCSFCGIIRLLKSNELSQKLDVGSKEMLLSPHMSYIDPYYADEECSNETGQKTGENLARWRIGNRMIHFRMWNFPNEKDKFDS